MTEVFKILNGIDKYEKDKLFTLQPMTLTRHHDQKLFKHQFRLYLWKKCFSQRVIDEWTAFRRKRFHLIAKINLSRLNKFWKNKATKSEQDCYSYPLGHANHYLFNEKRQERARESIPGFRYSNTVIEIYSTAVSMANNSGNGFRYGPRYLTA